LILAWLMLRRSSRLCVKNLPKGADEKRLREVFSRKGEVTDAKVIRTK
jgi:multiple RNA-binding domain-containing protein 1